MAITKVDKELGKKTKAQKNEGENVVTAAPSAVEGKSEPVPPSEPTSTPATDVAERTLVKMYTTPQPYVTRVAYSLTATIKTGEYENIEPKIEVEYIVPEGATPPNHIDVLEDLRSNIAAGIFPLAVQQTNLIIIDAFMKQNTENEDKAKKEIAAAFGAGSPLFKWLSTVDRPAARRIITNRIAMYRDAA